MISFLVARAFGHRVSNCTTGSRLLQLCLLVPPPPSSSSLSQPSHRFVSNKWFRALIFSGIFFGRLCY
uniref:Uncharacterized protein n=1 Tax=Rhizophora mucronata TaxID=61149 RepID=A0A2P2MYK8_RHIMU